MPSRTSMFTITPTPPTSLRLGLGEDGTFSFTVTSLAGPENSHPLVFQAELIGAEENGKVVDWLAVEPQTLRLSGGTSVTVTIVAKSRTTRPRGENQIQLALADNERPNEVYAYSAPVTCEVIGKSVVPPPRNRFWLPIAAPAGAAVALGLSIFLFFRTTNTAHQMGQLQNQLVQLRQLFKRAVVAFNSPSCPSGWTEYTPAYGRFVRGIDKTKQIDLGSERPPGNLQDDMFESHSHSRPSDVFDAGQIRVGAVASGGYYGYSYDGAEGKPAPTTGPKGGPETRPKNVALLYCVLGD